MVFTGLVAGIYYETQSSYWSHAHQRERGETFVYTIDYIIINHLNHFNIHAVVCTFHPSQLKFAYYSFTKASRLKAWRHCSQQLALLGRQATQFTCDNTICPFFKAFSG